METEYFETIRINKEELEMLQCKMLSSLTKVFAAQEPVG